MKAKVNLSYIVFLRKISRTRLPNNISDYMNNKKLYFGQVNFFQNSWGARFFLNVRILFKKVQCQSPGHVLAKFEKILMNRSKVYLANNFRGHPPLGERPLGPRHFFYRYDIFPGSMTSHF